MKTYALADLSRSTLAEIADIHHEPKQPAVWETLAQHPLGERDLTKLGFLVEQLVDYKTVRVNEATIWARAIYPLLAMAERGDIRAWSLVPLAATFAEAELRGEADGALAASIDEEVGLPYLVVVEAKRGVGARDPMAQLLGAMLCAAWLNAQKHGYAGEIYGCYTVADVWTFVRGRFDGSQQKPIMAVLSSREYSEKWEAPMILGILESIVGKYAA